MSSITQDLIVIAYKRLLEQLPAELSELEDMPLVRDQVPPSASTSFLARASSASEC